MNDEGTVRLTDIMKAEPDPTLFHIPADYFDLGSVQRKVRI